MACRCTSSVPISLTALVIMTFLAAVPMVLGQTDRTPPRPRPNTPNVPSPVRQPSIRERQMIMDQMRRDAATSRPRLEERERLAVAQITEDFAKLQAVNNKMLAENIPRAVPNVPAVIQSLEEMRKRATRLRENLHLPRDSSAEQRTKYPNIADAKGLKTVLVMLDEKIMSFIENPIFKKPSVIDLEQATRAGSDLDAIVELTVKIRKDAERLQKVMPTQ